jgi:hypothetical protein
MRLTGDPAVAGLIDELASYPGPDLAEQEAGTAHDVFVPLRVRGPKDEELSFFGTIATFGTAVDVTVAELSIESFFPTDAATAAATRAWAPR